MTDQTLADLIAEFQRVSSRIQHFYKDYAGHASNNPSTEAACHRNVAALFRIEQRIRDAGFTTIIMHLRIEHELTVGRALRPHHPVMPANHLRIIRRELAFYTRGQVGETVVP